MENINRQESEPAEKTAEQLVDNAVEKTAKKYA